MYLVNTKTLELEEFIEGEIPSYVILSHRWGREELNFEEVRKKRADETKRGYKKLIEASRVAAEYEVGYIWIDTCCIDKKSSAELSEAINSMFSWYKEARCCLAYLEDVSCARSSTDFRASFQNSVWFTRAWTLQELLAPVEVQFYNANWTSLGSRADLASEIMQSTRIPQDALKVKAAFRGYSVAARMSWASRRKATRTEDVAYSLLGIFDVNMPLLYGEGSKAYERLQEEIMRRSTDGSLLFWRSEDMSEHHSLLAKSPDVFTPNRRWLTVQRASRFRSSFTNAGLTADITLLPWNFNEYAAIVNMFADNTWQALILRRVDANGLMCKIGIIEFDIFDNLHRIRHGATRKLTILRSLSDLRSDATALLKHVHGFEIRVSESLPIKTLQPRQMDGSFPRWVTDDKHRSAQWVITDNPLVAQYSFKESSPAFVSFEYKFGIREVTSVWDIARQYFHLTPNFISLYVDVCFDFDLRPHVQVWQSPPPISGRQFHKASIEHPFGMVEWEKRYSEHRTPFPFKMATISDKTTGSISYVFRSEWNYPFQLRLPGVFAPSKDDKLWLSLVPPRRQSDPINDTDWWILTLTDKLD